MPHSPSQPAVSSASAVEERPDYPVPARPKGLVPEAMQDKDIKLSGVMTLDFPRMKPLVSPTCFHHGRNARVHSPR